MKTKIVTPVLMLLLLFLSGCGREESVAGNGIENAIESGGETPTEIENEGRQATLAEAEDEESASEASEKISCSYDSIEWISHDRAVVRQNKLSGIIDRKGNLIEPVAYDMVQVLSDGAVWLKNDKEARFYNNRGEAVENIGYYDDISKIGNCYQVEKNGIYGFVNEEGEEVCSPVYSYVSDDNVYGADNVHILADHSGDIRDSVIKTGEPKQSCISEVLLQNEITPRIGLYQEFARSGSISVDENENDISTAHTVTQEDLSAHKKKYKLYDLNNSGEPLLYFEAKPYVPTDSAPYSYSGFYTVLNNQLVEVVTAYEYSGYGQGDSACIWYDRETAQTFPGIRGFWGDIAENTGYGAVYDKKNGKITSIASFKYLVQSTSRFSDEELAHAELIYDRDGKPYTKGMIDQAENGEIAVTYFVNDEQTTTEAYQQMADRYQKISFVE